MSSRSSPRSWRSWRPAGAGQQAAGPCDPGVQRRSMPQLISAAGVNVTLPRRDSRIGAGVPHGPSLIGASGVTSASRPLSAAVQRPWPHRSPPLSTPPAGAARGEALAVLRSGSGGTITGCAVTMAVLAAACRAFPAWVRWRRCGLGGLRCRGCRRGRRALSPSQDRIAASSRLHLLESAGARAFSAGNLANQPCKFRRNRAQCIGPIRSD